MWVGLKERVRVGVTLKLALGLGTTSSPTCVSIRVWLVCFFHSEQFTCFTWHCVPRLVVLLPLLVVPVGGCTAAVCVFCTRTCGDSGFSKTIPGFTYMCQLTYFYRAITKNGYTRSIWSKKRVHPRIKSKIHPTSHAIGQKQIEPVFER